MDRSASVLSEIMVTSYPSTGKTTRVSERVSSCCMMAVARTARFFLVTMTFSESELMVLNGAKFVGGIVKKSQATPPIFARNFFMNSLTDELLGIKQDKFDVGDLVKTRAATDEFVCMPWLGIITKVTQIKNAEGDRRNLYTVDWVAGGEENLVPLV